MSIARLVVKKVYLLDMIICKCRCGNLFCYKHRINHNCSYDYAKDYKLLEKIRTTKNQQINLIIFIFLNFFKIRIRECL